VDHGAAADRRRHDETGVADPEVDDPVLGRHCG
jgi:hypothetical protein